MTARYANILIPGLLHPGARLSGKVRSLAELAPCGIREVSGERVTVEFDTPVFAPAPGQRLVLYDDAGRVIAGGEIV